MSVFVDTSVWSLAFRRDRPAPIAEVDALIRAIENSEEIVSTGLVLQELLQGFTGPKAKREILDRFSAIPVLIPDQHDHVQAADLRNRCRQNGLQIGTIDVLLAQLCIRYDLTMLTTDKDFRYMAEHCRLKLWQERSA